MSINITKSNRLFLRCCYSYIVNGMATLVLGSILPSIIEEAGLSFSAAGGLISVPVSYTHLDVYKRQSPYLSFRYSGIIFCFYGI